jgi:large subunit ribosomal protein L15
MEGTYTLKKPGHIKTRKRVGRGNSSGHGSQCCKGHDGQLSRAGKKHYAWFEGGQMPLQRRVPKRGFNNYTKVAFQVVNLSQIEALGTGEVNPELLKKEGAIIRASRPVKVLGKGDITKAIKITADAFSATAAEKIKKAGGEAIVRALPKKKEEEK